MIIDPKMPSAKPNSSRRVSILPIFIASIGQSPILLIEQIAAMGPTGPVEYANDCEALPIV